MTIQWIAIDGQKYRKVNFKLKGILSIINLSSNGKRLIKPNKTLADDYVNKTSHFSWHYLRRMESGPLFSPTIQQTKTMWVL